MSSSAPATTAELANWSIAAVEEIPRHAADRPFETILMCLKRPPSAAADRLQGSASYQADDEVAAMTDAAVLARFESLGDNCEFGIVQRACGVGAGGLLSFARTPPDVLADVLRSDLEDVSDPGSMRLAARQTGTGSEHLLVNDRYGIVYHIVGDGGCGDPEALVRTETARLRALETALRDKLVRGEHVFVMKCNEDLAVDEAAGILDLLSRYGSNALLYVVQADEANAEGSVTRVARHLYRGHIGRFAPYSDAYDTRIPAWTAICRNALQLHLVPVAVERV